MFPSSKLFGLCPDWSTCKVFRCPFSHTPPKPAPAARPTASSTSSAIHSAPTVPQKRSATDPSQTIVSVKRVATASAAQERVKNLAGLDNVVAAGGANGAGATGSPGASTSKAKFDDLPNAGPPTLPMPKTLTHTPAVTRQKMLNTLYHQFLEIYSPGILPTSLRQQLASEHALRQEEYLFSRATKATYRNSIISALARLKKRPPARSIEDTGTLEEEAERNARRANEEKGRLTGKRIAKFVHPVETLRKFSYIVEVPPGPGGDRLTEHDKQACHYHFGRMVTEKVAGVRQRVYSCCPAVGAAPCQVGPHVFKDEDPATLHSRVPFITSASLRHTAALNHPSSVDICALDCELVYTTAGMSLARVTVLSSTGSVLLDEHIRPPTGVTILDLNTRFSGVQNEDLEKAVLDVNGVRRALAQFIDEETVFVGHGLENDLKALRLVHTRVIDTAILFPHPNGGTWRHSLRNLTKDVLKKFIQEGDPTIGHSARDDAEAALELVRWKVKQDADGKM
ncbi:RNA exonuclease 1 [Rhodotorula toruloides]|uniref:RNA exonuclease 1 n=1 Tax=Rhodotorula toruloides TaxID=5286 RepID=A0A511KIP5_RHOTO|nr:RNA exonuclease 1 [Rhodotorula toruloides]